MQWQVATDERFRNIVREGDAFARPELAHSVHVEVGGLAPAREYFYRFRAGPDLSPAGRTKTAPALGASLAEMKFAFASCQQYEHGYFTAYRHMSEEDLDLVVHLGYYIYEYGPNQYVAPGGNVRAHSGPEVITLSGYRNRYAQYRTDEDLQAAHAAFAWAVTWDDHEVEDNYADDGGIPTPPGGCLPSVLRAHAPETFLGAARPGHSSVQAHSVWQPRRDQCPRYAAVQGRSGRGRRYRPAQPRAARPGPHADGRRAGEVAPGWSLFVE